MEWSSLWSTSSLAFVIDRLCNEDYSNSWKWSLLVTWSWVAPNISVMEQDDILEMQRNSIISLPQLLLYFPIILNIWSHPFMLVPHVSLWCLFPGMPSALFGFHPIGHFHFLNVLSFPGHVDFQDAVFPAWNSSCISTLVYVGSTYGPQRNGYSEKPSLTPRFWWG